MKTIGIVGGVGPLAGVDLHNKIIQNTKAAKDQEHLSVVHMSFSCEITDRSTYLLDPENHDNPGEIIFQIIKRLYASGARVIGVPCNTFHADPIFGIVRQQVTDCYGTELSLMHLIEETCAVIKTQGFDCVGLLATMGTYKSRIYADIFARNGMEILHPASLEQQQLVHSSIYHPVNGVKAQPNCRDNHFAREILIAEGQKLVERGSQCIIMGCTEIPLILHSGDLSVPLQDATAILAQAMVSAALA